MWAQHMQNVSERQSHFLHHLHLQLLPYVSKVLMTTQSAPTNVLLRFNSWILGKLSDPGTAEI